MQSSNCYRFKLEHQADSIESRFGAHFLPSSLFRPEIEFHGLKNEITPVIHSQDRQHICMFNWGLIKGQQVNKQQPLQHSNIEDIKTDHWFSSNISNRCLVLMDGFYEWQYVFPQRSNSKKVKYLVCRPDAGLFACAGVYNEWLNPQTGLMDYGYTILTTQANRVMKKVHNRGERMLVVLDQAEEAAWLDAGIDYSNFADRSHIKLRAVSTQQVQQMLF